MRITIDTDDKGNVKVDTGDSGDYKPGLFESTADVPVIDAGPAPVQQIEQMQKAAGTSELTIEYASAAPGKGEEQLPLNPLRAGAEAAYRDPANLRKRAPEAERTFAAQEVSINTIDGGSAKIPKDKDKHSSNVLAAEQNDLTRE